MTGVDVLMAAFGVLALASGVLAVTSRQVVHAALWLVVSLGAISGLYLLLGAEVIALVQLLVYVGAVVVLVLFALMLTRAPTRPSDDLDSPLTVKVLAGLVGAATTVLLGAALLAADPGLVERRPSRGEALPLGEVLFASWVLPFELVSVLLLAALVAAVAVSRGREAA